MHLSTEIPSLSEKCSAKALVEQEVQAQAWVQALISAKLELASMRVERGNFPLCRMFSSL